MAEIAPQPQSKFLSLPAELRNRIYREALVQPTKFYVEVNERNTIPREPFILLTCRQIRKEALSIFYNENTFEFCCDGMAVGLYIDWCRRSTHKRNALVLIHLGYDELDNKPKWANMLVWLEAYFREECGSWGPYEIDEVNDMPRTDALLNCFDLVDQLKGKGMDWAEVEEALEVVHTILMTVDEYWRNE